VAQGPVVTGGFAAGREGNSQTVNHPTVGRSPEAAIVERAAPSVTPSAVVRLQLRQSDFTTSARIARAGVSSDTPYGIKAVGTFDATYDFELIIRPAAGFHRRQISSRYQAVAARLMIAATASGRDTDAPAS